VAPVSPFSPRGPVVSGSDALSILPLAPRTTTVFFFEVFDGP
jgi:hypothetical protein